MATTKTVATGADLALAVVATGGVGTLSYVWKKSGTVIAGKTTASISVTATAAAGDSATYTCEVSDSATPTPTKITSTSCVVTVAPALTFTTNLATTKTVATGADLALAVVATGGVGTLSYVWKKSGTVIAGKTTASIVVNATAVLGDAGTYTCEVSDSATPTAAKITSTACVVTIS